MTIEKRVQHITNNYMEKDFFNSVDLLFHHNDEEWLRAGFRNQKADQDHSSIYDLASLTKIVTSTGILRLVTEKKLELDDPLKHLLPLPEKLIHEIGSITIQALLTHSSGLRAWFPFYSLHTAWNYLDALTQIDLKHESAETVVYSDLNYMLLGEVIRFTTDLTLPEFLKEQIVIPLELPTLTYGPVQNPSVTVPTEFGNQTERRMCTKGNHSFEQWRGSEKAIQGEVNDGNAHYFFRGKAGHAGLFGSIDDLTTILNLYLKGGSYRGNRLIDKALVDFSLNNLVQNRGLGWHSGDPFPSGFGHTGFTGTSIWIDPARQLTGVILTNRLNVEEPKNVNGYRKEIHQEVLQTI